MEKNSLELFQQRSELKLLEKIKEYNKISEKYGLMLSENDALALCTNRREYLKETRRFELGEGVLPKLIYAFCDSPYIDSENYTETLDALQEMFYHYKNEVMDIISDDELVEFMKEHFDGDCQGDLTYLEETCLELMARDVRSGRFISREE